MHSDGLHIHHGPRLADRTTLGLGGRALADLQVRAPSGLETLRDVLDGFGGCGQVLGAGSNILAGDADMPFVLLSLALKQGPRLLRMDDEFMEIYVEGGCMLPRVLGELARLGASGLEGLAGIPGSFGGAVAMNAGSFGSTIGDAIQSLSVYSLRRGLLELERPALELAYRHMGIRGLEGPFLVTGATLRLRSAPSAAIKAAMRRNMEKKRASQPVTAKSAGCVYKNPANAPAAGKLLEDAGFKGRRNGGMVFSPLHANFLVNEGGGNANAALDLMAEAEATVLQRFGVRLEREVIVWA